MTPPRYGLMQRMLFALAGSLGRCLIALYFLTIRIRNSPELRELLRVWPRPGIYAFWHAHQLSAVWHFRKVGVAIMISASRDGEYIGRIAQALGFVPVRGSSSRQGAAALREMIQQIEQGRPVAVTPDGPRGPRWSVKPGVIALAQKSGLAITPFAIGLSRYWELPSWDRFRIPKPFSAGYVCIGEPLAVPADADEAELDRLAAQLRDRMIALEQLADARARGETPC